MFTLKNMHVGRLDYRGIQFQGSKGWNYYSFDIGKRTFSLIGLGTWVYM